MGTRRPLDKRKKKEKKWDNKEIENEVRKGQQGDKGRWKRSEQVRVVSTLMHLVVLVGVAC